MHMICKSAAIAKTRKVTTSEDGSYNNKQEVDNAHTHTHTHNSKAATACSGRRAATNQLQLAR